MPRTYFVGQLRREMQRADRSGTPLSLVIYRVVRHAGSGEAAGAADRVALAVRLALGPLPATDRKLETPGAIGTADPTLRDAPGGRRLSQGSKAAYGNGGAATAGGLGPRLRALRRSP